MHSAAAVIVMLACAATEPLRTEAALAAGPWDDGTSRYALTHRRDDPEAPVPPPSFAEAEIVLHATMVAESEPPECTSDEYASFGNQRWTGEAYVDGAYHTFVAR